MHMIEKISVFTLRYVVLEIEIFNLQIHFFPGQIFVFAKQTLNYIEKFNFSYF